MPAAARTEENRARPQTLRTAITSHLERLAGEVDATRRDAGFLQALGTMSRFWRYSLLNQNFIRVQRPGATRAIT